MTEVRIGAGLTDISNGMFAECPNLRTVYLTALKCKVRVGAFWLSGVTDVYYPGTEEEWIENSWIADKNDTVPHGDNEAFKNATFHYGWDGHAYESTVKKATCTEPGTIKYTCKFCDSNYTEELPATGHHYESGICKDCGKAENWDYTVNNGKVTITGYTGNEKELEIPSAITGYPVTAIADSSFTGNKN